MRSRRFVRSYVSKTTLWTDFDENIWDREAINLWEWSGFWIRIDPDYWINVCSMLPLTELCAPLSAILICRLFRSYDITACTNAVNGVSLWLIRSRFKTPPVQNAYSERDVIFQKSIFLRAILSRRWCIVSVRLVSWFLRSGLFRTRLLERPY